MTEENSDLLPLSTREEKMLDITAAVISLTPWVGGSVSVVLSGMSFDRRIRRVKEVLVKMAQDIKNVESEVSQKYVQTEDFEDLLEKTLRQVADERNEDKRAIYAAFLSDAVKSPGKPYDQQIRILRTFENLQPDHIQIMKAYMQEPDPNPPMIGSISSTLKKRLPDMKSERISDLVSQLVDMRVIGDTSINTMMTGRGAEELRNRISPFGHDLLKHILS
jgi:hypothetical protein